MAFTAYCFCRGSRPSPVASRQLVAVRHRDDYTFGNTRAVVRVRVRRAVVRVRIHATAVRVRVVVRTPDNTPLGLSTIAPPAPSKWYGLGVGWHYCQLRTRSRFNRLRFIVNFIFIFKFPAEGNTRAVVRVRVRRAAERARTHATAVRVRVAARTPDNTPS